MFVAQAMIEKGALDGASMGMSQFRHQMTGLMQDERAWIALAVALVLFLFIWRMRG